MEKSLARLLFFVFICITIFTISCSQSPARVPESQFSIPKSSPVPMDTRTYSDLHINYSIQFPRDWKFTVNSGHMITENTNTHSAVGIWSNLFYSGGSLENIYEMVNARERGIHQKAREVSFRGNTAFEWDFIDSNKYHEKILWIFADDNNVIYIAGAYKNSDDWIIIQAIMSSLQFVVTKSSSINTSPTATP